MRILAKFFLLPLALLGLPACALAEELAPGVVIDASTWEALKDQTFEGHRIADLVPPGLEVLVREYGLKLPLRHSGPLEFDPRYLENTKRYAKDVRYDPTTRLVSNYVSGMPFPDVQQDALGTGGGETAATKLMWNFFLANPLSPDNYQIGGEKGAGIFHIDGRKGIDRRQEAIDHKFRMVGRKSEPHTLGDGSVYKKQIFMLTMPYDVRGVGGYTIRYMDGRADDSYVYVKSVRRLRRVSGNTWMDPLGAGAFFNEDNFLMDIHPVWYPKYNLLGEETILAVVHGPDTSPKDINQKFDFKEAPYWNPIGLEWEPREVYVIDGTPPSFHLYGRKILYMEKSAPFFHMTDIFDRQGKRWRVNIMYSHVVTPAESPNPGMAISGISFVDLQQNRASVVDAVGLKIDAPDVTEDHYSQAAVLKLLR